MSAHKRPTSHLIVISCVHILRNNLKTEEINILRQNDQPSKQEEDDSDDLDEKEDASSEHVVPLFDLEYLNNSKDAVDIKLRKYFDTMPKHAIVANILDPRVKLRFASLLDTLNASKVAFPTKKSGINSNKKTQEIVFKDTITELFEEFYLIPVDDETEDVQLLQ